MKRNQRSILQSIEFEFIDPDGELSDGPPISFFPEIERTGNLIAANDMVTNRTTITIRFSYPLTKAVEFQTTSDTGFTKLDLFRAIYNGYKTIYTAEKDPGTMKGPLLNRAKSKGPYGIYGHYMTDLVLDSVDEVRPGYFELTICS